MTVSFQMPRDSKSKRRWLLKWLHRTLIMLSISIALSAVYVIHLESKLRLAAMNAPKPQNNGTMTIQGPDGEEITAWVSVMTYKFPPPQFPPLSTLYWRWEQNKPNGRADYLHLSIDESMVGILFEHTDSDATATESVHWSHNGLRFDRWLGRTFYPDGLPIHNLLVAINLWWFVTLASLYPLTAISFALRKKLRTARRLRRGLCLHCAYDLRHAAEGLCPECGNPFLINPARRT